MPLRIFSDRVLIPVAGAKLVYFSNDFRILQIIMEKVWNESGREASIEPLGINAAGQEDAVVFVLQSCKIKRLGHLATSISRKPQAADLFQNKKDASSKQLFFVRCDLSEAGFEARSSNPSRPQLRRCQQSSATTVAYHSPDAYLVAMNTRNCCILLFMSATDLPSGAFDAGRVRRMPCTKPRPSSAARISFTQKANQHIIDLDGVIKSSSWIQIDRAWNVDRRAYMDEQWTNVDECGRTVDERGQTWTNSGRTYVDKQWTNVRGRTVDKRYTQSIVTCYIDMF